MTERGLKNISVFYSMFTKVFYFCHVFLRFLTFFIFSGMFFTSMQDAIQCAMRTSNIIIDTEVWRILSNWEGGISRLLFSTQARIPQLCDGSTLLPATHANSAFHPYEVSK